MLLELGDGILTPPAETMISELKASQVKHVAGYGPFLDKELSKTQAVGSENHIGIESLRLGLLACLPSMLVSQHRGFYDIRNLELGTQKAIGKFRGNFKIETQADSPRSVTVTSYYACSYGCPTILAFFPPAAAAKATNKNKRAVHRSCHHLATPSKHLRPCP